MTNHLLFNTFSEFISGLLLRGRKYWHFTLSILLFSTNIASQPSSYQYIIETDSLYSESNGAVPVMANEQGELALVLRQLQIYDPHAVVRLFPNSSICQGYSYSLPDPNPGLPDFFIYTIDGFKGRGDWAFMSGGKTSMTHLLALNLSTGEYWCKKPFTDGFNEFLGFSLYENGDLIVLNRIISYLPNPISSEPSWIEVHRLDSLGSTVWKKGFLFIESAQGDPLYNVTCSSITTDQWGNMYLSGYIHSGTIDIGDSQFLIKFDAQGNPLVWKKMVGMPFGITVFTEDAIYLLDKSPSDFKLNPDNRESAIIAKYDYDLNLLWLKKYSGENFRFYSANITESSNGGIYLSCSAFGAFPVILAELDADGNIIKQKGYANYTPRTELLADGSLAISSNGSFDSLGNFVPLRIVAKTDGQGDIEGCVTLPTCIEVADTTVIFGTFHIEPHPVSDLKDVTAVIEPISFDLTPFCDFPPPPVPDFTFPDTLCLGDSATTTGTYNRLANAHEWRLTGPGVDSVSTDSFDFGHRFLVPGEYLLQQTVWVLGCAYPFEKTVTVLPGLEVGIAPNTLCPGGPQEITATANRPATFLWHTGGTSATLPAPVSGTYSVQATDGHCTAADTSEVTVVAEMLAGQEPITFTGPPFDCSNPLPYMLEVNSPFADTFYVDGNAVTSGGYALEAYGHYLFATEIAGCHFSKTFELEEGNCEAAVYLPNVISPNGDGINDVFWPQGSDFETVSLKIYDRWGGLRYDGQGSGAVWSPGGSVPQGAYLYHLVYKNLLTGMEEARSGDVVVVR